MSPNRTEALADGIGPQHPYHPQPRQRDRVSSRDPSRRKSMPFGSLTSKFIERLSRHGGQKKNETPAQIDRPLPPTPEQAMPVPIQESRETETRAGPAGRDRLFQGRLDVCSENEIVEDCKALNNKIRDAVLSIIDEWTRYQTRRNRAASTNVINVKDQEHDDLRPVLGDTLYRLIKQLRGTRTPSEDLQNRTADALQASAVYISNLIVSETFCPALPRHGDVEFHTIFKHMVSHELQATALHWRALTYVHAVRSAPTALTSGTEAFAAAFNGHLTHYFQTIFILAGENSSFLSRVQQSLAKSGIIEYAMRLDEKLKTTLFSSHLDAYLVKPKLVFDENTMDAEETIETHDAFKGRLVACTVELGIREIVSGKLEGHMQGERGRILLKPRVLLEQGV